jgi:hypothetical protein
MLWDLCIPSGSNRDVIWLLSTIQLYPDNVTSTVDLHTLSRSNLDSVVNILHCPTVNLIMLWHSYDNLVTIVNYLAVIPTTLWQSLRFQLLSWPCCDNHILSCCDPDNIVAIVYYSAVFCTLSSHNPYNSVTIMYYPTVFCTLSSWYPDNNVAIVYYPAVFCTLSGHNPYNSVTIVYYPAVFCTLSSYILTMVWRLCTTRLSSVHYPAISWQWCVNCTLCNPDNVVTIRLKLWEVIFTMFWQLYYLTP